MTLLDEDTATTTSVFQRLYNFDQFITGSVIKIIYLIGAVLILLATLGLGGLTALGGLLVAVTNFSLGGILTSLFFLVLSLAGGALGILILRVYCELIMVVFKINENLQTIRDRNSHQ
jgi:hypothetical protein